MTFKLLSLPGLSILLLQASVQLVTSALLWRYKVACKYLDEDRHTHTHTHLYETLLAQCVTQYLPYMSYPASAYLIIDMRNSFRNEFAQSEKRFLGEEGR